MKATPAQKFYFSLRKEVYKLAKKHRMTGFEVAGVLAHLGVEVSASSHIRDGIIAPGENFED